VSIYRNYVNKIGIRLSIPIIDAGTLAYKGNVTTIIPRSTSFNLDKQDAIHVSQNHLSKKFFQFALSE
jgi:molybdopterin/thiamine biosynthesis adenylyltransferase